MSTVTAPMSLDTGGSILAPRSSVPAPRPLVLRDDPRGSGDVGAGFALEWAGLLAALACVGAVLAASLWHAHGSVDAAERDRLAVQARVVDENVAQQIDGVNRALASVRDDYLAAPSHAVSAVMSTRLKAIADALPGVRSLVLLDSDGNVGATSVGSLVGRDFSDRDYFRAARNGHDPSTLHVAAPYRTSLGTWTIVFTRAIVSPSGAFVGAVAAALEPDYFGVLMRSVLYAPDMVVSLGHSDGKTFVIVPRDETRPEIGNGGGPRLMATREISPGALRMDRPLVATVGRSEAAVFRDWQHQSFQYAAFLGLLCAAAAFGLHRAQARRVEVAALRSAANAERQSHAEQLALALHSADMGLWTWDLANDRYTFDATGSRDVGVDIDGPDRLDRDWRRAIHNADRPRLMVAVEAHFRGDVPTFDAEFRVRHHDGSWVWMHSRGRIVERDGFGAPSKMAGTHLNITERKRTEARIARTGEMLRRTGELANIGGWELELSSGRLEWSEQVFRIHDLDPGEAPPLEGAIAYYAPEAQPQITDAIELAAADGTPWDLELPFVTARGRPRWVRTQGVALMEDGKPARLLCALQDVTERKTTALELLRLNEQLQRLSTTDPLTEVGNRRLFDQTLRTEWSRAARRGEPVGLLMIDLDHFKEYNDHYGHPAGDACLRQVARLIGDAVRRGGELVSRYGGEEFALLLPGATLADALLAAERCSQLIAEAKIEHRASPMSAWVTVSIGAASQNASSNVGCEGLVDIADAALYRAKRCGRGRIES